MLPSGKTLCAPLWAGLALLVIVASAHAATAVEEQIGKAETTNRAWLKVVNTRLAYERERLSRLRQLHDAGHASWLETERQAVTVEALVEHQRATLKCQDWLSGLRAHLDLDNSTAATSGATSDGLSETDSHHRLRQAKAAMDKAQREFDALQKSEQALDTPADTIAAGQGPARLDVLRLALHPQLARATLRTAESQAEAKAYGKLVGLLAHKARLRYEAIQKLHAKGIATSVELKSAEQTLADAEELLETAQQLAQRKETAWTELRQQLAVYDADPEPLRPLNARDLQKVVADPDATRDFIALQIARFQIDARRRESDIEARLQREFLHRLERANLGHESGRRERQMARLDLALAKTRSQVASEQQAMAQIQTHQLLAAADAQRRQARLNQLVASAANLVAPRLAVSYLQWPRSPLFSSFAIPPQPALIAWNAPGCFYWRDVGYWYGRRARVLPFSYGLWGFGRSAWWTNRYYAFGPYCGGYYHHGLISRLGYRPRFTVWAPSLCRCYGLSYPRYRIHTSSLRAYLSSARFP